MTRIDLLINRLRIFVSPLIIGGILLIVFSNPLQAKDYQNELLKAQQDAVKWLSEQMVPNSIVPNPTLFRRNLILSYRMPESDPQYPYLHGRSFLYDNALAAIAFSMVGDFRRAEFILNAINRLVLPDGSLWFSYNAHNSWPTENDNEGAIKRIGATAWVGYAIVYYLQKQLEADPSFLDQDPMAQKYVTMAEQIATYLESRQIKVEGDKRNGLITGGKATYSIQPSEDFSKVVEEYRPERVYWASAEHNIDSYYFFRDLGRILQDARYNNVSEAIKKGLYNLWSDQDQQFFRGIKKDQQLDRFLPLDTASWGALFLLSAGDNDQANRSLIATQKFLRTAEHMSGYTPYHKELVHESRRLNQYYYPKNPNKTWKDINLIWVEGSLGVAVAYLRAGMAEKALKIMQEALHLSEQGGFKYASIEIPFQFNTYPSVASTAWYVIAAEIYLNNETLFWGQ